MIPSKAELDLLNRNICQALGDPKRVRILYTLHERPRHVTALAADLNMPQPTVSRHLRILRQRMLVHAERKGSTVIYNISDPRLIDILNMMRTLLQDVLIRQTKALTGKYEDM